MNSLEQTRILFSVSCLPAGNISVSWAKLGLNYPVEAADVVYDRVIPS